jgi:uncharacterized integral membrane protein
MPTLDEQLLRASEAMLRYAFASGITVPESVADTVHRAGLAEVDVRQLTRAHNELVRLVAPATPRTILVVAEGRRSALSMLGPVRLVRQMLVVVILLLILFLVLASSHDVTSTSGDFFQESGVPVLINGLFFLVAGGLGAAFSALFTAQRYIKEGIYDPKYESTYWLRFILGLMAGLLLPALVPLGSEGETGAITRPLLALLGGFSAAVLYRILERLVSTVETLVRTDPRQLRTVQQEVTAARSAEQTATERLALVSELRRLQDQARADGEGRVADGIEELVDGLLPARLGNGTGRVEPNQG